MAKSVSHKSSESEASEVEKLTNQLAHLPKTEMPSRVSPMLASPTTEPFDDDEWIFEDKLDGYRAVGMTVAFLWFDEGGNPFALEELLVLRNDNAFCHSLKVKPP